MQHVLLIVFAVFAPDREMVKREAIHLSDRLKLLMIADNAGDIERQLIAFPAPEQVYETVIELRYQNGRSLSHTRVMRAPIHVEAFGNGTESLLKFSFVECKAIFREADAHKKHAAMPVC